MDAVFVDLASPHLCPDLSEQQCQLRPSDDQRRRSFDDIISAEKLTRVGNQPDWGPNYDVSRKKRRNVFADVLYKTQAILVKFVT